MNARMLKAAVARQGYTLGRLAKELGISDSTMNRKIKNDSFTIAQVKDIIRILDIEDPVPIFFAT